MNIILVNNILQILNKRVYPLLIFCSLLAFQNPIFCNNRDSKYIFENYLITKKSNRLSYDNPNNLKKDSYTLPSDFKYFLNILLASFNDNGVDNNNLSINIESDVQKEIDSVFIAEGNVIVRTNNSVIRADIFKYDQNLKKLYIEGNIKFKTNFQFFIAEKIEYDFINKKGFISDVYGSINFDKLANINLNSQNETVISDDFSDIYIIKDVKFNNSSKFSINNIFNQNKMYKSEKSFENKFEDVNNTRFSSEKININGDVWQSEMMLLTTDPYNYPQLTILNKDFNIYFDDGVSEIESKWTTLNLDNKIRIPLGSRRIKLDEDQMAKWGIGFNNKDYDGLFLYRNSENIEFGKDSNSKLNLKPMFFIQRSVLGDTKSFPKKNSSTSSPKVKQKANWPDYFGIFGSFVSDLNDWMYVLEFESNSLDFERFNNSFESRTYLTKNLFFSNKDGLKRRDLTFFGSYRDKTKNGSLGEKVINTSYGARYDINKSRDNKSSEFSMSYGNYEAQSQINESLINKNRLNVFLKNNISYSILEPKVSPKIDQSYLYSPNVIRKGLFFDVETKLDFFRYGDSDFKQDMFSLKAGPKIIFGDFRKKFFDYTELRIYPRFKFNRGRSPFTFDQIVDNRVIELVAKQQIYGPLTLQFTSEINIDEDFENDRLINPQVDLGINRRAYTFTLFYNIDSESGGFNFNINSFNFNGLGNKFR